MVWENLKTYISAMKVEKRTFSGFEFRFKTSVYIGVLSITENDLKENKYAIAKIFIYKNNLTNSLIVYPTWKDMSISPNIAAFYSFFEIDTAYNGNHFKELKKIFMSNVDSFVPSKFQHTLNRDVEELVVNTIVANDPKDPNKRYCTGIKLNGLKSDGKRKQRTDYNDEKSRFIKPELYEIVGNHKEISFNYSKNIEDKNDDPEILHRFIANNSNYGYMN